jgi:hypothetical protein
VRLSHRARQALSPTEVRHAGFLRGILPPARRIRHEHAGDTEYGTTFDLAAIAQELRAEEPYRRGGQAGRVHDFVVGPRATRAIAADARSPAAQRERRRASVLGRLNVVPALLLVGAGVMLVRGVPW